MQNQDVFLQSSLDYFKDYNLEANRECEHLNAELEAEKVRYRELLEAQKNNAEFMALSRRVTDLEKQLRNKTREKDEESKKRYRLEAEIEQKKERQRDVSGERSGRAETSGRRTKAQPFRKQSRRSQNTTAILQVKIKRAASCAFRERADGKTCQQFCGKYQRTAAGVQQPQAGRRTSADRS